MEERERPENQKSIWFHMTEKMSPNKNSFLFSTVTSIYRFISESNQKWIRRKNVNVKDTAASCNFYWPKSKQERHCIASHRININKCNKIQSILVCRMNCISVIYLLLSVFRIR